MQLNYQKNLPGRKERGSCGVEKRSHGIRRKVPFGGANCMSRHEEMKKCVDGSHFISQRPIPSTSDIIIQLD